MLRIQFDGLVIELGRDRSSDSLGVLASAMPLVLSWLQARGFASWSPPAPKEETN